MTPADKDILRPNWLLEHVEAAVAAGIYALPADQTVNQFVEGIDLIRGVPSPGSAPKVTTRPDRCLLWSQNFQTSTAIPCAGCAVRKPGKSTHHDFR